MAGNLDLEAQYDKIYRYCYFKLGSREMAEDITQEAFLRFLEKRCGGGAVGQREGVSFEKTADIGKTGALRYLYTIARNLCIDEYRKKKHQALPLSALGEFASEDCVVWGGCTGGGSGTGVKSGKGTKGGSSTKDRNNTRDRGNKRSAVRTGSVLPAESDMEERLVTVMAVRKALDTLTEAERELVLLRYVNEVPVGIIGKLLGISRFSVYRMTKNALEHLREELKREGF